MKESNSEVPADLDPGESSRAGMRMSIMLRPSLAILKDGYGIICGLF
jgi:hypothetical protein